MAVTGVSHSCLLIELGTICKSMAAYLKAIIEVYGKTITGLGPKEEYQALFCWIPWLLCL